MSSMHLGTKQRLKHIVILPNGRARGCSIQAREAPLGPPDVTGILPTPADTQLTLVRWQELGSRLPWHSPVSLYGLTPLLCASGLSTWMYITPYQPLMYGMVTPHVGPLAAEVQPHSAPPCMAA